MDYGNKIIVLGCPGSGKSTFSKKLHELTQLPLIHLDKIVALKELMTDADDDTFDHRKYCVFCCSEYEHLYGPGNDADRGSSGMASQSHHKTPYCRSVIPDLSANCSCRSQYDNKPPVSVWSSQQHRQNNTVGQHYRIHNRVYYHHDCMREFACQICLRRKAMNFSVTGWKGVFYDDIQKRKLLEMLL